MVQMIQPDLKKHKTEKIKNEKDLVLRKNVMANENSLAKDVNKTGILDENIHVGTAVRLIADMIGISKEPIETLKRFDFSPLNAEDPFTVFTATVVDKFFVFAEDLRTGKEYELTSVCVDEGPDASMFASYLAVLIKECLLQKGFRLLEEAKHNSF